MEHDQLRRPHPLPALPAAPETVPCVAQRRRFQWKHWLALAIAVSTAALGSAHEGAQDDSQELVETSAKFPIAPSVPGAREFALEMEQHAAPWLFGNDELLKTLHAARWVRLAGEMAGLGKPPGGPPGSTPPPPVPTAEMEHARSLAESQLAEAMSLAKGAKTVELSGDPRPAGYAYYEIPGDFGYLLLKIVGPSFSAAQGPARFVIHEINLEKQTEIDPPLGLPIAHSGVTWLLLKVVNAPVGRTREFVTFNFVDAPGVAPFRTLMGFEALPQGQLRIEIVDENGQPTPAMVRLTSKRDGSLRRPEGALDFSAMTDDICSGPTAGFNLPEPLKVAPPFGGFYWVVDGGFQMALPQGPWEIHVQRGAETVPVHEIVDVTAAPQAATKRIVLQRWTDMKARGWWSGDDHVHSRMTSDEDAKRLMVWVKAADIHVANILRMGNRMRTYYEQRGFGPGYRWIDGDRALVPGQEDPRYSTGHIIGLNLKSAVRDETRYLRTDWVAETIHAQGGLFGHAHVSHEMFGVAYDMTLTAAEGNSDFGSVMQGPHFRTRLYYDFLNLGFRLAASSGTDTPYSSSIGESRVYAYLGEGKAFSPDAWFDAMRRGRTFVTNGPMLDLRVDEAFPGDEVKVAAKDPARKVRIRASAWGLKGASAPAELRVVSLGESMQVATANDATTDALTLDFQIPTGRGFWVAAYARGRDGSEAHSTPIYVVREGFRPWKLDKVPELIARRTSDLNALATMLKQQQQKAEANETWFANIYDTGMAEDAPGMLERIERARERYQALEKLAAEEAAKAPQPAKAP